MAKKKKQRSGGVKATKSAPTNTTNEARGSKKQISTASIQFIKTMVDILKPLELSKENRLKTFQAMMLDDAVGNAFGSNAILVEKAFAKPTIEFDKNDPMSVLAAEFLEYNLANLDGQTLRSIARSAIEFKRDGLAPMEKVFKKNKLTDGWENFWVLSKLSYIHPLSLDQSNPFSIEEGGNKITELRQSLTAFQNSADLMSYYPNYSNKGYVPIARNKVVFMSYAATDAQPFGQSPFDIAYTAWREKVLISDYALVGLSKDLAGMPLMYVPEQILLEAAADPSSQSGLMVEQLKVNMANMSAGDQSSAMLPSTLAEGSSTVKDYELKFLGVEGNSKSFDVIALVEQRKKAIYNCFGAANLITGETGGSYNLIEGKNTIHTLYIERDISVIEEGLNKDVIPQLFRMNGWKLTPKQMPKVRAGEIQPISLSELGQFINRTARLLPATADVGNVILERMGTNYRLPDDITPDDYRKMLFEFSDPSKTGTGNATSGGGSGAQDNSDANKENK